MRKFVWVELKQGLYVQSNIFQVMCRQVSFGCLSFSTKCEGKCKCPFSPHFRNVTPWGSKSRLVARRGAFGSYLGKILKGLESRGEHRLRVRTSRCRGKFGRVVKLEPMAGWEKMSSRVRKGPMEQAAKGFVGKGKRC